MPTQASRAAPLRYAGDPVRLRRGSRLSRGSMESWRAGPAPDLQGSPPLTGWDGQPPHSEL